MLGAESDWLFNSLVEDLLVLLILVELSLLDWRQTEQMNVWSMM